MLGARIVIHSPRVIQGKDFKVNRVQAAMERQTDAERETNNKKEDSGRHKTSMMRQKEINNIKR